jgi:hypothetical protein
VYGVWSIWLWLTTSFAVYPLSMPIPPWNSAGSPNTWLSLIVLWLVWAAPVAVGRSTLPIWMPLPDVSVTTLPLTRSFCEPSPSVRPAAPRWTKASPVNWMFWS